MFKPWGHLTSPYVTSLFGWDFFALFRIFLYYMFERSTCTYVCMCITWVPGALEPEEGILYPGIGVTVVVSPIWVLGPKPGQLQQEQVLLNTELSLQPKLLHLIEVFPDTSRNEHTFFFPQISVFFSTNFLCRRFYTQKLSLGKLSGLWIMTFICQIAVKNIV